MIIAQQKNSVCFHYIATLIFHTYMVVNRRRIANTVKRNVILEIRFFNIENKHILTEHNLLFNIN